MRFRVELAAVVFGLVLLNLLLAFVGIGLFTRMGPAIDGILLRNDATIVAAEEIVGILAVGGGAPVEPAERERAFRAVARARDNVTEEGEQEIVDSLDARIAGALDGQDEARRAVLADLRDLVALNREAMWAESDDAHRLGTAGAWVTALVGVGTLAIGLWLRARLDRRIVQPMQELGEVLRATQGGDRFRRCVVGSCPEEIAATLQGVNRLLDARDAGPPDASEECRDEQRSTSERSGTAP